MPSTRPSTTVAIMNIWKSCPSDASSSRGRRIAAVGPVQGAMLRSSAAWCGRGGCRLAQSGDTLDAQAVGGVAHAGGERALPHNSHHDFEQR